MSCEKTDNKVIDPTLTFPAITSAFVNPASMNSITINTVAVAVITSDEQIASVKAAVTDPTGTEIISIDLKDDGVLPDTNAGDKHYSGLINKTLDCKLIGTYKVQFIAQNLSGLSSNTFIANFTIEATNNQPPVISDLIIPDSIQVPLNGQNLGFLQVKAIDPDGQCDISQNGAVHFNSFKPNGIPSTGNPFSMYDDGDILAHGDTTVNDSKFSLIIGIPPNTATGYYKFIFNATDRSNSLSNTIIDSIYVYQ